MTGLVGGLCWSLIAVALLAATATAVPLERVVEENWSASGDNWAVLVAGSNTYANYRHQADVCHAYQVLINHGFNPDRIIVFMYDDIAQNIMNPTKGVIINQPNGPNVYAGVAIDYKGNDVNPTNFLNVIKGNKSAMQNIGTGRVLESTSADNVFINFVDHGGPGLIAFPSEFLRASELSQAMTYMHTANMYNQLVFYLEACESGSMFDNILPANTKVFATTAANPDQSSYAIYYDQTRHTYLGDVYSVMWMQNADAANLNTLSLVEQYKIVKAETNTSVVSLYGDTSFQTLPVGNFLEGRNTSAASLPVLRLHTPASGRVGGDEAVPEVVPSRDVDMALLRHRVAEAVTPAEKAEAAAELAAAQTQRAHVKTLFESITATVAGRDSVDKHMTASMRITDRACVESTVIYFHETCLNLAKTSWAMEHTRAFVSMCTEGHSAETINAASRALCKPSTLRIHTL